MSEQQNSNDAALSLVVAILLCIWSLVLFFPATTAQIVGASLLTLAMAALFVVERVICKTDVHE